MGNHKLRAGIVGTGFIGKAHIEAIRRLGYVELTAIADLFEPERQASELWIPHWFSGYREMVDSGLIDVLHICTPNAQHFDAALYALQKGLHVICEKPLAISLPQAEQMLWAAQESGRIHAVNFHNRFYPMIYEARQRVRAGEFGRIFSIHGEYIQDWILNEDDYNWRVNAPESGATRAVSDIGSHWFDAVQFITGERIIKVCADFSIVHPTRKKPIDSVQLASGAKTRHWEEVPVNTEDIATVMFRTASGVTGSVMISQVFAGKTNAMSIKVAGSKESICWSSEESNYLSVGRRDQPTLRVEKSPAMVSAETAGIIGYPGGHVEGFPDAFKQEFSHIYAKIAGENPVEDFATFFDGLQEMRLCEAMLQSAKTGSWVAVAE
ncbi:MAG: Gfo/Idh/MocA family oxidoreductase [Gorillibacterium sp.]|nr:Gfo/Idh/MocA family oxidoreductase [Gorillibacterium sp.]